mmetsp:Transcript_10541/g.11583  ORF Transcript_10541/g.11583 Transcript_10541/m.11583 type:complete len:272 (-) Transcript_10541:191-1006(-)
MGNPIKLLAWRCLQPSVAYRSSPSMADIASAVCSKGDAFVGYEIEAPDGSMWLHDPVKQLYLPLVHPQGKHQMFEELWWNCTFEGKVQARKSPNMSDMAAQCVKHGAVISAVPTKGWLMEAESKLFYPLSHPHTCKPIFQKEQVLKDDPNDLLKLLQAAKLEDWHAKFIEHGYQHVKDVCSMDRSDMAEIGLLGGHRKRLERVLPKKPLQCGQHQCMEEATSKCHRCGKMLCLLHVQSMTGHKISGGVHIVTTEPACLKCKQDELECCSVQ